MHDQNPVFGAYAHLVMDTLEQQRLDNPFGNVLRGIIHRLQLDVLRPQYDIDSPDLETRLMAVVDYISGMTDVYALDVYQKICGISLPIV